jgi:RNA polymerase sigma factor (sigma-70 family)
MVGDDAEDLGQEAGLRAYLGLPQLRARARLSAWWCGIAVNVAKMWLRRRARELRLDSEPSWDGGFEAREVMQLVRDAVKVLPAGQREAVLMHYVDDLSCDDIATLLQTSPAAVRVRLHRARQQLRRQLASLAPTQSIKEVTLMIETGIDDVIVRVAEDDPSKVLADQRIVLLKARNAERVLPIWIGSAEGNALAFRLTGETPPRPLTSDLMAELVRVTGTHVEHVAITSLQEKTFHASIRIVAAGSTDDLDARPSDAINLAVRVGAPILVDETVLDEQGIDPSALSVELETKATEAGHVPPVGTWRSLSAELLQSAYRW